MTDIFIKSFNRPYYLARCIESIRVQVRGDYKIIVMDDGTPEEYLEKIRRDYPETETLVSAQYKEKVKAIEENLKTRKAIDGFQIPTKLWTDTVRGSGKYIIVTEDDVWFTEEVNPAALSKTMEKEGIHLLKLGWMGNTFDDQFLDIEKINSQVNRTVPHKLFTGNEYIMDLFMYNRFKFFSLMYKLGLADNFTKRKYWALNSIFMGLYNKEYWLHIWKDAQGRVDEKQQLRNAATWYHKRKKNRNLFARTASEKMKTTFQSAATGSYHPYGCDFDVNYFNHLMNRAWLEGRLNPMENYPKDFSLEYFESFFDEKVNKKEFRKWVGKFKDQYRNLGAETD